MGRSTEMVAMSYQDTNINLLLSDKRVYKGEVVEKV